MATESDARRPDACASAAGAGAVDQARHRSQTVLARCRHRDRGGDGRPVRSSAAAGRSRRKRTNPTPGGRARRPSAGLFEMPPIVTNLGSPKDTWIRLEASIVFDAKALPHPEILAGEIAGDELAYLRTVTLAQIEGPIGLREHPPGSQRARRRSAPAARSAN